MGSTLERKGDRCEEHSFHNYHSRSVRWLAVTGGVCLGELSD